jgi:D-threonate/D-erythronate kinase
MVSGVTRILAISDDLTGATACAADMTRAGRVVSVRPSTARPHGDPGVVVVDSSSRLEPASVAAARLTGLIEAWQEPGERAYYHRIDSQLRGHVAAELDAVCRALDRPLAVAPAAPAFGAVTRGAVQRLEGCELAIAPHVPRPLVEIGLAEVRGQRLGEILEEAVARRCSVICDAETERDLALVAGALRTVDATPVGSYGLGRAWAREGDGDADGRQGVIAAVGSLEPATLAQVAAARAAGVRVEILGSDLSAARAALRRGEDVVLASAEPGAPGVAKDPEATGRMVAAMTGLLHDTTPSGLVLVGGQLASELIRSMGVEQLDVICEPWPAVPVMRLRGGSLDGLAAAVKSGAREGSDWLISSLRVVGSVTREAAS